MIIFPMAGLSSRFFKAGYDRPKYMLSYGGKTVFTHVVSGFADCFGNEPLVFTCRSDFDTPAFVERELRALGLEETQFHIHCLDTTTRGQAETVLLSISHLRPSSSEPLTIFNVDTVRHNYRPMEGRAASSKGFLEVVREEGDHWSFVLPEAGTSESTTRGRATKVIEKRRISDLCSTGLYHFNTAQLYQDLYEATYSEAEAAAGLSEQYIAPLYQTGIDLGLRFDYQVLDREMLDFCGTPQEYEFLCNREGD